MPTNLKILRARLVKKLRDSMNADRAGRECECCGKKTPFGDSMYAVSVQDGEFKTTEYFCVKCNDKENVYDMVYATLKRREDFQASLG